MSAGGDGHGTKAFAAKIGVSSSPTVAELAAASDGAEERVRAAVPVARAIYLEPDLRREHVDRP